ncbi:hypothetical protein QCE63_04945 [Caballeronia sp. LZ065]|uniref:hypothetical protein n=1 Tax=Caballeronia sp. LZ065 TaxID=3038571 RepID=UPI00285E872D|nr:hypothetical protein [Caballeronia sp. LZ065]MDR5778778.1 hypothetical protein [Caballeronia sp. LZ065]
MVENIDSKELVSLVDTASGDFVSASEAFADISALFQAIAAASPADAMIHRLARLGEDLADRRAADYEKLQIDFNGHTERFMRALRAKEAS